MILAHGPLGYLIGYGLRTKLPFSKWLLWCAAVGGMLPDLDLLYFYFANASLSHRQLLSHGFLLYVILIVVGVCARRWQWGIGLALVGVGGFSHVLADMLIGQAAALAPFNDQLYGLVSWSWFRGSVLMDYSLVTNFVVEYMLMFGALITLVRQKRRWLIIGLATTVLVALLFGWINQHAYKPDGWFYYGDNDADGILNAYDRDLDGDGFVNMIDSDVDNDGEDNSLDFYLELFSAEGALFDYSFGHFIEVPLRIGLVNDQVLVQRLFANSGIFINQEMTNDYQARPTGYQLTPSNNEFSTNPANIRLWLEHTQHLLPTDAARQEFDVIFFQSGQMAIFTRVEGEDVVLDVDRSHPFASYQPFVEVSQREGGILAIGRILPKPYQKRY